MAHQIAVTVCAQLRTGSDSIIAGSGDDLGGSDSAVHQFRWAGLPSVHFARLVKLDETIDLDGNSIAASLIYMADVDVSIGRHLRDLVAQSRAAVDEVFGRCVGYPVQPTDEARLAWLTAHHVRPAAYYVHRVGRTARQIDDEANLRSDLERAADADPAANRDRSASRGLCAPPQRGAGSIGQRLGQATSSKHRYSLSCHRDAAHARRARGPDPRRADPDTGCRDRNTRDQSQGAHRPAGIRAGGLRPPRGGARRTKISGPRIRSTAVGLVKAGLVRKVVHAGGPDRARLCEPTCVQPRQSGRRKEYPLRQMGATGPTAGG